jgi:amidophosphoribosyltransferase
MFQTTVDSEIILTFWRSQRSEIENNLIQTCIGLKALLARHHDRAGLIGVRDPHGFRPPSIGKVGDAWVLASETCAFDLIHAEFLRDVEPGEIVIINKDGLRSVRAFPEHKRRAFCILNMSLCPARQHDRRPQRLQSAG